jgi:hypothetical protein
MTPCGTDLALRQKKGAPEDPGRLVPKQGDPGGVPQLT